MIKKSIYFIISLLFLFSFTSCKKQESKIMLSGNLENQTVIMLDNYTLENKIQNDENFVLVVLLSTCSTCENFKNEVLNPYIKKTSANLYGIDLLELESYKNYENKPYLKEAPSLMIYKEGEVWVTLKYEYGKKEFTNITQFEEFMGNYVVSPKLISISEELLDLKINNKESFILYIGWNKCGDCKLLESQVLNDYLLEKDADNVIYYLESDNYRKNKPNQEPKENDYNSFEEYQLAKQYWDNWISFASKYQFVDYRNGKIPTVQYYENGLLKQDIVYHNDVIENGQVTISFFEECIQQFMNEEELLAFHNQKMIEFLNSYYLN